MNLRTVLHLFVLSSAILAAVRGPVPASVHAGASGPSAQTAQSERPLRYGRVSADGAAIYNLQDEKAKDIARPAKGQLVAVYKEGTAGWLEVEVPGGFPVWVFGKYLQTTSDPALLEVTGNAINLRPLPSSDVTSFPLPQRLQAGDRVRVIELAEPEKPLAETWVRVWSPPGVRGFLKSSLVEGLTSGEDGAALWTAALANLPAEPPARASAARPKEPTEAERKEAEARVALEEARALLETESGKETPDYDAVEAALQALVAYGGTVAIEARGELRRLTNLREAAALKAELHAVRQQRSEEVLDKQREVWEQSKRKDPLGGVFAARGVVERRTNADGVARFYLRFGTETTAELVCSSGRYDLSAFNGTEVGVHGSEIASRAGELPTFEVARLEVIAVR